MNNIKVYDIEKKCGLEDNIRSQSSVAFTSPVVNFDSNEYSTLEKDLISKLDKEARSAASIEDPDLYHVYSILVSTSWNRNDDIFNKEEVWAARNTPRFKPTNLEHDEKQMVGGIVNSWPVDNDFEIIDDNIEVSNLPDVYHILVSSVIFRQWQDMDLKARAEKLISEIEEGKKFVSMECIFRGFDYGVISPAGDNHIVARTEQTAFLTQHLRSYGGAGVYQDHKIGRVLRDITFSGKGFVDRPANPDSIIFDKEHMFSFANIQKSNKSLFLNDNGVIDNIEEQLYFEETISSTEKEIMSDNQILNDQIAELKEALASVKNENKDLSQKLSEANVSAYEEKISKLQASVEDLSVTISDLNSKLEESVAKSESLENDLEERSKSLEEAQAMMDKMHEEKKKKDRKEKMADAGFSAEDIEAKYETFADLDDAAFDSIIETVAEMHYKDEEKKKKEKAMKEKAMKEAKAEDSEGDGDEDCDKEDSEGDDAKASEIVEEEADQTDIAISSESEEDEISTARASLQEWVENNILK